LSKIHSKISSIEADDNVVSKALGLRPIDESQPLEPVAPADDRKVLKKSVDAEDRPEAPKKPVREKTPAIVNRPPAHIESTPSWPLWVALAFAALWLIGSGLAIAYLFKGITNYSAGQLGGVAFFLLFPLLLIAVVYWALKNLVGLNHQASRLESAADALMRVDDTVVRRATEMSGVIKREIDTLNSEIDTALTRATTLQDVLESETGKLGETSLAVEDKTQKITERLATEREALWSISNTFDEQMKALTQSLDTHSENLAMSTKTAEQKIQEARLSVENTASKINQTSDLIRSNTVEAATTLTGNQEEILKLSNQLKQRAEELDQLYSKHGQDLNAMIAQLKNEQEVLSHSLEERLSKMRDVALSAQVSAERLTEASEAGRQTVISLSEAAHLSESAIKNRFTEMEEMVKFSNARAESISDKAARRVQDSLSQTRKEIARIESDMLDLQEKMSNAPIASPELKSDAAETRAQSESMQDIDTETEAELIVPEKKSKGTLKFRPVDDDIDTTELPQTEASVSKSPFVAGLRPAQAKEEPAPEVPPTEPDFDLTIENGLMRPGSEDSSIENDFGQDTSIKRTLETENVSKSWWKNLFGKPEESTQSKWIEPSPLARAGAAVTSSAAVVAAALPTHNGAPDTFLRVISSQGLSPNAIVDNGCIIEAVENRIQAGTKQMSIGVARRLGDPVRLLSSLFEGDPALKNQAVEFAVNFHHNLTPIAANSDSLEDRFGTEDGRLFLMCDAALNGIN